MKGKIVETKQKRHHKSNAANKQNGEWETHDNRIFLIKIFIACFMVIDIGRRERERAEENRNRGAVKQTSKMYQAFLPCRNWKIFTLSSLGGFSRKDNRSLHMRIRNNHQRFHHKSNEYAIKCGWTSPAEAAYKVLSSKNAHLIWPRHLLWLLLLYVFLFLSLVFCLISPRWSRFKWHRNAIFI